MSANKKTKKFRQPLIPPNKVHKKLKGKGAYNRKDEKKTILSNRLLTSSKT
jgi:stalled ribosome alternative rescue factor ArfA